MSATLSLSFVLMAALGAALAGAALAVRLRQSVVLGYLLAGLAIGPVTPGPAVSVEVIEQLAEIGVVLLLFVIGAQLSLRELVRAGRVALVGALAQVGVMVGVGALVGRLVGLSSAESFALGAVVSNSSSTVIAKLLGETGEVDTQHARLALAWSSVQDVSTVLLLAVLASLGDGGGLDLGDTLLRAVVFCVAVLPIGLWGLPRLFRGAARGNRELFTLLVVFVALAMAWVASLFGVSLALGAFIAGVLVGESDVAHRVLGDAIPLRDVFSALFFVSVGMLVSPAFLVDNAALVALTLGLIVVVKGLVTFGLARLLGTGPRVALLAAAALAQSAEFSFLMARESLAAGIGGEDFFNTLLSATAGSILFAPLVGRAAAWGARHLKTAAPSPAPATRLRGHVVVCGYGRVGALVCTLLERAGVSYAVVDDDLHVFDRLRARGVPVVFGDAGLPAVLDGASVATARIVILCVPDAPATRRAVDHALAVNPRAVVLARSHTAAERAWLYGRGVREVVVGEAELGLELGERALRAAGVVASEAERLADEARREA